MKWLPLKGGVMPSSTQLVGTLSKALWKGKSGADPSATISGQGRDAYLRKKVCGLPAGTGSPGILWILQLKS